MLSGGRFRLKEGIYKFMSPLSEIFIFELTDMLISVIFTVALYT